MKRAFILLAFLVIAGSRAEDAAMVSRVWTGIDFSNLRSEKEDSNGKLFDQPEPFMALHSAGFLTDQRGEDGFWHFIEPEEVQLHLKFNKAVLQKTAGETDGETDGKDKAAKPGLPEPDSSFITDANSVSVYGGGIWYLNHLNFEGLPGPGVYSNEAYFTWFGHVEGGGVIDTEDSGEIKQDHFVGGGLKITSSYEVYAEVGYNYDEKYEGAEDRVSFRGAWFYRGTDKEAREKANNYKDALKWTAGVTFGFSGAMDDKGQDETVIALFIARDMDDVVKSILGIGGGK